MVVFRLVEDLAGKFVLSYDKALAKGDYVVWAQAENEKGALSEPTKKYSLEVGLPAFLKFGKKHIPKDPVYLTTQLVYDTVPGVLTAHGKAKSPWPNVDAGSGSILFAFGLTQFEYYTVLFSVSRAMGMLSQQILNRALGTPITRPKSVSTEWLKAQVKDK